MSENPDPVAASRIRHLGKFTHVEGCSFLENPELGCDCGCPLPGHPDRTLAHRLRLTETNLKAANRSVDAARASLTWMEGRVSRLEMIRTGLTRAASEETRKEKP